ncbi:MAG: phosphoglycerate kinase [Candidatus Peregrinibacteria bacterium]|nr:phosphoglycerate kinase [Candidatus Peregrinibacteria bacterium]
MKIRTLKDLASLKGKKVLLRVDFNVPLKKDGSVQDDTRMVESLPTIKYLQKKGAKIIIVSHLGRPDGKVKEELRLTKVAKHLQKILKKPVKKVDECIGEKVEKAISALKDGQILMLENVRFHKEEEACEVNFTKKLAALADIYVNDAFGTAHRRHASTAGVADYLKAYAGLLMEKEIKHLSPLLDKKIARPLTMIFGGAKIDTKIGIIQHFLKKADYFLMGGALANTFLYAEGHDVGGSIYEKDKKEVAVKIMKEAGKDKFILPVDVVVSNEISDKAKTKNVSISDVAADMKILDIGKQSALNFCKILAKSKTVIWNGPLGLCEFKPFQKGTEVVGKFLAKKKCTSILGGGDTADSLKRLKIKPTKFTHVSTGGGACIEFLSGEKLPGIEALKK